MSCCEESKEIKYCQHCGQEIQKGPVKGYRGLNVRCSDDGRDEVYLMVAPSVVSPNGYVVLDKKNGVGLYKGKSWSCLRTLDGRRVESWDWNRR